MKHVSLFNDFLRDTVNLNQTRIDLLEANIGAIERFVRQAAWSPDIVGFKQQGSWAHDTIIKPVDQGEFDADLLVMVKPVEGWSASDYVWTLGKIFSESATYGEKTKTWEYCVTVTYAGDRKVDITPCVMDRSWVGSFEVCNRKTNIFERSEPIAYTAWMVQQNGYSGSNSFRKVTRILKYLRDIKGRFTCPSVLLTTLLGNEIHFFDQYGTDFVDVPTALRTIMQRLDERLQASVTRLAVPNPKLSTEEFGQLLTDQQYTNLRNVMHRYRAWADEAFAEEDRAKSIAAWRRLLGDEFAKGEAILVAKSAAIEGFADLRSTLRAGAAHLSTLVEAVKQYGLAILPEGFATVSHMQAPRWRQAGPVPEVIRIIATYQRTRDATEGRPIASGTVVPARGGIWFDAIDHQWSDLPSEFYVEWRITNTGEVALARNQGRGGFEKPQRRNARWEEMVYVGVHIAEAFVIRRQDDVLVARSKPFYVVIDE